MSEHDPLHSLMREWKAPEPGTDLDNRVLQRYRATVPAQHRPAPAWRRFWGAKISIPAPALLAAILILIWFFRFFPAASSGRPGESDGVVTRLNATGFEPLPNGEARIVPAREIR